MANVVSKVMPTVNASYGANLSAQQLANLIVQQESVTSFNMSAFAFFSDVSAKLQSEFITELNVDKHAASLVAKQFSDLAGYKLALAEAIGNGKAARAKI